MKRFYFILLFCLVVSPLWAVDRLITNFADTGPGSLRWALDAACADAGDDVIRFAPTSLSEIRIPLESPLVLPSGCVGAVTLFGNSETETILDGHSLAGSSGNLIVQGWGNLFERLTFVGHPTAAGLVLEDGENIVRNNFFGVYRNSSELKPNQMGIRVVSDWNVIEGNTISSNRAEGILLEGSANTIRANRIGDREERCPDINLPREDRELLSVFVREISYEEMERSDVLVPRSIPEHCGNGGPGIRIRGSRNLIGGITGPNARSDEANRILYNRDRGIVLVDQAERNQFSQNVIAYNRGAGIDLEGSTNRRIQPLSHMEIFSDGPSRYLLMGEGVIGTTVDLYLVAFDEEDDAMGHGEGAKYLESFPVRASPFTHDLMRTDLPLGSKISAIVCDDGVNCSEFSQNTMLGTDSDEDGLMDLAEDRNANGRMEREETDPFLIDTDRDGLPDSIEDPNENGIVDAGETDPRKADTDNDGISDFVETGGDGIYDAALGDTNSLNPNTDGDTKTDGEEDRNQNGVIELGETDPRNPDTDGDGISD